MRRVNLDFRSIFRRYAKKEAEEVARSIEGARPKKRPDGKPTGGGLSKIVKKAIKVRRSGYTLTLHKLGQKLMWFARGKKGQAARPLENEIETGKLISELETEAASRFASWDRGSHA